MSAIALLVRLVKLRVDFIWPGGFVAIQVPPDFSYRVDV
jgi:hypothetical protein